MDLPNSVRKALIQLWQDTPVDSLLGDEFAIRLRPWLAERGYLRPTIATRIKHQGEQEDRRARDHAGARIRRSRAPSSRGNRALERQRSRSADLRRRGIEGADVVESRGSSKQAVADAYRSRGYLDVKVTAGEPQLQGTRAELPVTIVEGAALRRSGTSRSMRPARTGGAAVDLTPPVKPGDDYTDSGSPTPMRQMQARFRRAGYRGTRVRRRARPVSDDPLDGRSRRST